MTLLPRARLGCTRGSGLSACRVPWRPALLGTLGLPTGARGAGRHRAHLISLPEPILLRRQLLLGGRGAQVHCLEPLSAPRPALAAGPTEAKDQVWPEVPCAWGSDGARGADRPDKGPKLDLDGEWRCLPRETGTERGRERDRQRKGERQRERERERTAQTSQSQATFLLGSVGPHLRLTPSDLLLGACGLLGPQVQGEARLWPWVAGGGLGSRWLLPAPPLGLTPERLGPLTARGARTDPREGTRWRPEEAVCGTGMAGPSQPGACCLPGGEGRGPGGVVPSVALTQSISGTSQQRVNHLNFPRTCHSDADLDGFPWYLGN